MLRLAVPLCTALFILVSAYQISAYEWSDSITPAPDILGFSVSVDLNFVHDNDQVTVDPPDVRDFVITTLRTGGVRIATACCTAPLLVVTLRRLNDHWAWVEEPEVGATSSTYEIDTMFALDITLQTAEGIVYQHSWEADTYRTVRTADTITTQVLTVWAAEEFRITLAELLHEGLVALANHGSSTAAPEPVTVAPTDSPALPSLASLQRLAAWILGNLSPASR